MSEGAERESPAADEGDTTSGDVEREALSSDVEREGAPDLWTNARETRPE